MLRPQRTVNLHQHFVTLLRIKNQSGKKNGRTPYASVHNNTIPIPDKQYMLPTYTPVGHLHGYTLSLTLEPYYEFQKVCLDGIQIRKIPACTSSFPLVFL